MLCPYCNSNTSDENDVCQNCGRLISSPDAPEQANTTTPRVPERTNTTTPTIDEERQFPTLHWRCTWLTLFFHFLNAVLFAGVLAGGVWVLYHYYGTDETLIKWKETIWIIALAIPAVYFLLGFLSFIYNWFIKRYELHPLELRLIKGVFVMTTNSMLLEKLWGMKLRQNILQRILGTGKITLFSDDVTSPILHINDIGDVRPRFRELARYQDYALDCSNVKVERDNVTDTSVQEWRYSVRDLIDEIIWGLLILLVTVGIIVLTYYFQWGNDFLRYSLLVIPAAYWIWLGWTFIDKLWCTKYTLYNATLVKESGFFSKKIDVYVLCHIQDCTLSQNLWQKIVGDVGNIILYLKWENKDAQSQKEGSISATKKDVLHGLLDYEKKYEKFRERWLRERHRRQPGP